MNIKKYIEKKIFVTGLTACGKTTFAKEYAKQFNHNYINFDDNWIYQRPAEEQYDSIMKKLTDDFIIDAIPYATINGKFAFLDYYDNNKNNIKIVCVCCTDKNEFNNRIEAKRFKPKAPYTDFYDFYFNAVKNLYSKLNIDYYDSFSNELINEEQLYERIKWILTEI